MITNKNIFYVLVLFVASFYIHEIGHVIALWGLGISSYVELTITSLGLVLRATWEHQPTDLFDIYFAAFFGPFFSGIVFMLIGKFIKPEAYVAGAFQLSYAPFEMMSWILYGNVGMLNVCILFIPMVFIPMFPIASWAMTKVEKCNKMKYNSLN